MGCAGRSTRGLARRCCRFNRSRAYADRVVVVSDAAGLVKPTTGGGIYYSLHSAEIARGAVAGARTRRAVG
jgi:flavin-dependent dehydrogenase